MDTNNELQQSETSPDTQVEPTVAPVIEGSVEGTEQTAAQPTETTTDEPKPEKTPAWVQKRIDQLTAEKYEKDRVIAELRQQQAAAPVNIDSAQPNNAGDVEARAQQIVSQRRFDDACNAVYNAGKTEFPDFDESLANFKLLGGLPPSFLEAATQMEDGHKVLYKLGQNPEEASRILGLPPVPMAMELAKLMSARAPGQSVSKVPAPIKTLEASSRVEVDPEKMSQTEWEAWRNKTKKIKY